MHSTSATVVAEGPHRQFVWTLVPSTDANSNQGATTKRPTTQHMLVHPVGPAQVTGEAQPQEKAN